MKKIVFSLLLVFGIFFQGCDLLVTLADEILSEDSTTQNDNSWLVGDTIKEKAYKAADSYTKLDTRYESGKMGRAAIPFDCSGLVIRCYEEALWGSNYTLPFNYGNSGHPSAQNLHDRYSTPTSYPERGDLIFLNFNRYSNNITHVGIFISKDYDGTIHFIDASDYSSYAKVVDYRKLRPGDSALKGFGEMKLTQRY